MSAQIYQFTGSGLTPIVSQNLIIGQRVRQSHKCKVGVICGESQIGYTVIYPDGSQSHDQRLGQRSPFTRIELVDGIASAEEVESLKALAVQKRQADREAQEQAKNQHQIDIERYVKELRTAYPWAKANKPSANLKKELSMTFPKVKFSVRADHNSIRIHWVDGPTAKQVETVSSKYQDGNFNGMEDIHEYDHSAFGEAVDLVLGRATYVFESRSLSARFLRDIVIDVCFEYGHDNLPMVEGDERSAYVPDSLAANVPYCNGAEPFDTLGRKIHQTAHETAA